MANDLKIDLSKPVRDHFRTLVDATTGKPGMTDYGTFLFLPVAAAGFFVWKQIWFNSDFIDITVSGLSIFVGLLLNVMVILFDVVRVEKVRPEKIELVRESIANIAFCIILSLLAIASSYASQLDWGKWYRTVFHFLAYALIAEFMVTLLMVLKRMYALFVTELREIERKAKMP